MLLLTTLKWDVSAVVSTDFIEHLIARVHLFVDGLSPASDDLAEISTLIRQFSTDLCFLCCRGEYELEAILSHDPDHIQSPTYWVKSNEHG